MDELKNNRAPLLCYVKLCATFQSNWWIHPGNWKRPIRVKIGEIFLSLVTLKFNGWPWKTTWALFYVTSSFVHHFIAIGESKLELQSGNVRSGQNWRICCSLLPWNLIGYLSYILQALYIVSSPYMWNQTGVKLGFHLCDLDHWPLMLTFCMNITSANGNNSWKFHADTMKHSKKKRCDGRTDEQTDGLNHSVELLSRS